MIKFIDVSHWKGAIDWGKVKSSGIDFAYTKATEQVAYTDSMLKANVEGMEKVDIKWGAFHYFRGGFDPIKQAQYFYSVAKNTQLPPVLDIENINNTTISSVDMVKKSYQCLKEIERLFGRKPLIYTGPSFWNTRMLSPAWSTEYTLWIANYGVNIPNIPKPWTKWLFWQYTDREARAGKTFDTNWFNGSKEELMAMVKGSSTIYLPIVNNGSIEDRVTALEKDVQALKSALSK